MRPCYFIENLYQPVLDEHFMMYVPEIPFVRYKLNWYFQQRKIRTNSQSITSKVRLTLGILFLVIILLTLATCYLLCPWVLRIWGLNEFVIKLSALWCVYTKAHTQNLPLMCEVWKNLPLTCLLKPCVHLNRK